MCCDLLVLLDQSIATTPETKFVLLQPQYHEYPFPFYEVCEAFSGDICAALEALFVSDDEWQYRDGSFYQCSIMDVTQKIPKSLQTDLLVRMRAITHLPLVDHMRVTAQRMQPGQAIGVHSDRPLLGYEILRLVVQLNKGWCVEHGGVLELFARAGGDAVGIVNPVYNKGFIFELNESSYHGVTKAIQPRRSVVFNFWHAANTPELDEQVKSLFADTHFSELPAALEPIASTMAIELPEETTFIAETAAVALKRWGYDDAIVIDGYQYSAGVSIAEEPDTESYSAIRMAHWVATLYRKSFKLEHWNTLHRELSGVCVPNRLKNIWRLCLPDLN